jgi:hypothetical protein
MGLDMYLEKRTHVRNWEYMKPEQRHQVTVKRNGEVREDIQPDRISEIVEHVAYWRKANAIHNWFVEHVQKGEDNCQAYYVSREKLAELKATCDKVLAASKLKPGKIENGYVISPGYGDEVVRKPIVEDGEVIADPQIAETLLPTTSGFFFGGTNYDEYYYRDIEETSEVIGKLLTEEGDGEFYYQSSW